ncbi:glycosyltransferase family 4 protein [Mangrovimonas sp. AS39]|uniref:glycosyltransferase family 4 protein n=1 Tax=Mangrovimonas futianensis TaxID=2895523 RepID=UPI001E4CB1F0|nr:glycosyltransferase family 4 protein [Mangrovimonas futianensis]MCF1190817.1 glycosyltransferase family 4 protein [Mangrovimonas futianensis]MCF1194514.1 glycosyltransferase family 4 protein [Mangrovimonas futianensis]
MSKRKYRTIVDMDYSTFKDTRFLFVVNTYQGFGGAERQALIFAHYLKKHVTPHVAFLALQNGGSFKDKLHEVGIETYCLPFDVKEGKFKKLFNYYRLVKHIKRYAPDVIIPYVAESNKVVAQIWKYTGASFAFWNQREEGRNLYGTALEQKLIRQVPAIVSNSFEGRDALVKVYGLEPNQVNVINNGVLPYGNVSEVDWYEKLNISKKRPLISMIANITERKDHPTLLRAWAKVVSYCKNNQKEIPYLVLAGRKDNMYDKLRLLAFDLNLSEHLSFVGELHPVQTLIRQSLFCVFSSNKEGCPNGVLECMEQGKAVVGTDISGVHQALGERYVGQTISKQNSPEDLSKQIIGLLENLLLVNEIGDYNKQRITHEFSVEKMVHNHLKLIEGNFCKN